MNTQNQTTAAFNPIYPDVLVQTIKVEIIKYNQDKKEVTVTPKFDAEICNNIETNPELLFEFFHVNKVKISPVHSACVYMLKFLEEKTQKDSIMFAVDLKKLMNIKDLKKDVISFTIFIHLQSFMHLIYNSKKNTSFVSKFKTYKEALEYFKKKAKILFKKYDHSIDSFTKCVLFEDSYLKENTKTLH